MTDPFYYDFRLILTIIRLILQKGTISKRDFMTVEYQTFLCHQSRDLLRRTSHQDLTLLR
jgi:hypothetical protein